MKLRLVVAGDPSFAGVPGSPRGRDKRQQPQRELWMAGARAQADQLAAAKTLRRLCFSLAAVAAIASPVLGQTMQHAGEVKSAQFSPDGRWVVTASKDYTARLWDATTGQAVGVAVRLAEQGIAVLDAPPAMGCADCPDCIHA
jgi:hypothetical protein